MRKAAVFTVLLLAGPAFSATITAEGEAYTRVGGPSKIQLVERASASGGKVVSYWEEPGVWLEWEFAVPEAADYAISIRYACAHPESFRRVDVDGQVPTPSCERMRFDSTGGWATHAAATVCDERGAALVMSLSAGKHRIRMTNVDSVGLAVDVIYVHDPGRRFTDVALGQAESATIAERVRTAPGSAVALSDHELRVGDVRVAFTTDQRQWAWAANTFLEGASTAVSEIRTARTSNVIAQLRRVSERHELYATDGHALYVALAAPRPQSHTVSLWPRAYAVADAFRELVLWRTPGRAPCVSDDTPAEPADVWLLGAAQMTSSVALRPLNKSLAFPEPTRLAALKIAPPTWSESGLEIKVESTGQTDTLHSSARDFPALGAFYGYGRFRVDFVWGKGLERCTLTDLVSGERVELLAND